MGPQQGPGRQEWSRDIGKTVGIAGEHSTGAQMAATLTRASGQEVRYNDVPPDIYRGFGFPGAEDLGNMFQLESVETYRVVGACKRRSVWSSALRKRS
jgi:hypothetical protein